MKRLIYISSATRSLPEQELLDLVSNARENNRSRDVTGMLLLKNHTFLQVLEGESEAVDDVFERIGRDDRATGIVVLVDEPIASRDFPGWFMGYNHIAVQGDGVLEALETTGDVEEFDQVRPGAALDLLKRFANR